MNPITLTVKEIPATVLNNWFGSIAGGLLTFYIAKKYGIVNKTKIAGISFAGVLVGSHIQKAISAKLSQPTVEYITKK